MFSPIASWFYRTVAGVQLGALRDIIVHPRLQHDHSLLSSVHLELQTSKGFLSSSWQSGWQQRIVALNVSLPHNARGRIVLECPQRGGRWAELRLNGQVMLSRPTTLSSTRQLLALREGVVGSVQMDGVESWRERDDGVVELEVGSGTYELHGAWM